MSEKISFPWTMIDKITPRPSEAVREALEQDGLEGMDIVVTRQAYLYGGVCERGKKRSIW